MAKFIVFDLFGSIVWFPVWWYTTGLRQLLAWAWHTLSGRARAYGFGIWIRHFFVPMYGQSDLTGRMISVFMRAVVLIGRTAMLALEALVYVNAVLLWIFAPVLVILVISLNIRARLSL